MFQKVYGLSIVARKMSFKCVENARKISNNEKWYLVKAPKLSPCQQDLGHKMNHTIQTEI